MSSDPLGPTLLILITILIITWIMITYLEHKKITFIHENGLAILMGTLAGCILYYLIQHETFEFNKNTYFFVLLPIIVFSEGYLIEKRFFFKYMFYILLFGVIGTLLNFILIYSFNLGINKLNWIVLSTTSNHPIHLTDYQILIFSMVLCSTETLAGKAFIDHHVYPKLFNVLYGEQCINDIIVFSLIIGICNFVDADASSPVFTASYYGKLIAFFIYEVTITAIIGCALGLLATLMTKYFRFLQHNDFVIVSLIIGFGYICFNFCKIFNLAGVVSILVAAVIISHYMVYNLTPLTQQKTIFTIKLTAFISEFVVYIYVGLQFWEYIISKIENREFAFSWTLLFLELALICFCRILVIFILTHFSMITRLKPKSKFYLNRYDLGLIGCAGMVRGSIVVALIQILHKPDITHAKNEEEKMELLLENYQIQVNLKFFILKLLQTTCLAIVLLTTFIFGGILKPITTFCLKNSNLQVNNENLEEEQHHHQAGKAFDAKKKKHKIAACFKKLDTKYLKSWLIFDYNNRKISLKLEKGRYKDQHHKDVSSVNQNIFENQNSHNENQINDSHMNNEHPQKNRVQNDLKDNNSREKDVSQFQNHHQNDQHNVPIESHFYFQFAHRTPSLHHDTIQQRHISLEINKIDNLGLNIKGKMEQCFYFYQGGIKNEVNNIIIPLYSDHGQNIEEQSNSEEMSPSFTNMQMQNSFEGGDIGDAKFVIKFLELKNFNYHFDLKKQLKRIEESQKDATPQKKGPEESGD